MSEMVWLSKLNIRDVWPRSHRAPQCYADIESHPLACNPKSVHLVKRYANGRFY